MTTGPTDKQVSLLEFIAGFGERHGYPPSLADIRRHHGARSATAGRDMLVSLERKGLITRRRYLARSIVLTPKGRAELALLCSEQGTRRQPG